MLTEPPSPRVLAGRMRVQHPVVSHCQARTRLPRWPRHCRQWASELCASDRDRRRHRRVRGADWASSR